MRRDTLLFWCYMLMGSVSGTITVQMHLTHCYSETCGDNTGEMPGGLVHKKWLNWLASV